MLRGGVWDLCLLQSQQWPQLLPLPEQLLLGWWSLIYILYLNSLTACTVLLWAISFLSPRAKNFWVHSLSPILFHYMTFTPQLGNWELMGKAITGNCYAWFFCGSKLYFHYFSILSHYCLSQDIEYSSLCCTVGPCCLSILNIIAYIC